MMLAGRAGDACFTCGIANKSASRTFLGMPVLQGGWGMT